MRDRVTEELLSTTDRARGHGYWGWVAFLAVVIAWGFLAWLFQLYRGLGVTGLNTTVFWGFYITNFVFFIGISHAGTLISAILRLSGAEWRRPVTRAAEAITVFALVIGAMQIIFDMGRPDRILNLLAFGRIQSPLLWDVLAVTTYLFGSVVYLYLPLIPDIAGLRERLGASGGWRARFYQTLSLGWKGTERQKARLTSAMRASAIMVIPLAVSVHTVVSYIFAMTVRPMWHSTIFGPYFVIGAIYSGIAAILIAMGILRKSLRLENYLKELHFQKLGYLLLVLWGAWFYATLGEYLITGYGSLPPELRVLLSKTYDEYGLLFWGMVFVMLLAFLILIPLDRLIKAVSRVTFATNGILAVAVSCIGFVLWYAVSLRLGFFSWASSLLLAVLVGFILWVAVPTLRQNAIMATISASILVILGMWLERFTIIVPTLTRPIMAEIPIGRYSPTWVEFSLLAASFSLMALLFFLFVRYFPIIPAWEIEEGKKSLADAKRQLEEYVAAGERA